MMMRPPILLALLLAACGEQSVAIPTGESQAERQVIQNVSTKPTKGAAAPAKPVKVEEETSLYTFAYSYPAEAAAVPQLVERFQAEKEKLKAELVKGAQEDRDERTKSNFDYHAHDLQRSYETAGKTERLLSLEVSAYGFTGGAHGLSGSGSLLWDYVLTREIAIPQLVQPGQSWTGAIRQPFCILLDRERERRREAPVNRDDLFGNCPGYEEVTVLLQDTDTNGRFDHILVSADQYVAGPYAEGPYEIALPITAAMIERLKPEYRSSFEPRPGVK